MSDQSTNGRTPPGPGGPRRPRVQFTRREREAERQTRRPMPLWDRIKFLLLLGGFFLVIVQASADRYHGLPFATVFRAMATRNAWLI